jgi:aromatic-L-amino-acid/L-tryptophan decarboxylase
LNRAVKLVGSEAAEPARELMTDQVTAEFSSTLPAEPADLTRITDGLTRLSPALQRYIEGNASEMFPAYRSGSVPSEAGPLPEVGIGLDAMVDELATVVELGCRISVPGWLGFVTTGATTAGVVAQTATSLAGGQRYLLHSFNALERTGLRWLAELCGLPPDSAGVFTSGGSSANLVALGAARQAAFERRGVDVANDGLPAGIECRIYVSARAHRTIHRSAGILGLGRRGVREIPIDRDGRVNLSMLEAALREDAARGIVPIATVAVAGTTDTGSVDAIADIVSLAREFDSWVHVDGAYGLIANASPSLAPLFAGVADADSWIVDPHKWLACSLGVGAVFVRNEEVLTRAFAEGEATYLEGSFSPAVADVSSQFDLMAGRWADQSLELSAPPRGSLVWAVLREIGRAGVVQRVERHVAFARRVADRAREDDRLELVMEPQLSITCFRYVPAPGVDADALNQRLLERLRRETPFIPTSTIVNGVLAIRPCFINPRTTEREVDGLVDAVIRIGDELSA